MHMGWMLFFIKNIQLCLGQTNDTSDKPSTKTGKFPQAWKNDHHANDKNWGFKSSLQF